MRNNISGRKIAAGKPGTKRLMEIYGENLVCVRYRYDAQKRIKYKTVEIIVDSGFWDGEKPAGKIRNVEVQIDYEETDLRTRIKNAGGTWNRAKKVWEIEYKKVRELGIEDRIAGRKR